MPLMLRQRHLELFEQVFRQPRIAAEVIEPLDEYALPGDAPHAWRRIVSIRPARRMTWRAGQC